MFCYVVSIHFHKQKNLSLSQSLSKQEFSFDGKSDR